jgi:hypothetical protein
MFRGRRRFVVLDYLGGLNLEGVQERKKRRGHVVYYSVSAVEKRTLRVVRRGTKRDAARARKLLEDRCMPWTRIEWDDGGQPNYIHDVRKFPAPPWSSK